MEYRLVYDIRLTNISNNEKVNLTITQRSMQYKTGFYGLNKKIKNARRNSFMFNQKNTLTIKIDSSLSIIIINHYLQFRIPMCHRVFFKLISQNREYVKNNCNDLKNPFHFACRKWSLYNNPQ